MINKRKIIGGIAILGVVVGILYGEAMAQTTYETHPTQTQPRNQFRYIEQPLSNKVLVTLVGLGLISLELWWFLLSKAKYERRK